MVHLVQHDERAAVGGARPVQRRRRGHLRVGHDRAAEVPRGRAVGVAERGVERDPEPGGRQRPLVLQVLGRGDDGDRGDGAVGEQFRRHPQREGRLACAGCRHREEIRRPAQQIRRKCAALPCPQRWRP
jgi:hypothetical protein